LALGKFGAFLSFLFPFQEGEVILRGLKEEGSLGEGLGHLRHHFYQEGLRLLLIPYFPGLVKWLNRRFGVIP